MTTRTTNRIARAGAPARCRLCVVFGPDAGLEVEIPPAGVVVGASASCDVVLADRAVSSRHCAIRPSEAGFKVTDLGSRNGVHFDGAAIADASVPAGAALRLGGSIVQLLPADEAIVVKPSARESFGAMVGGSLTMRRIFALLELAAASSVPVLLTGETGTGKEVCARAVHENSPRRDGPFVVFDCAAASESLIESDLFGHVRGAFTGAERERPGAFASAHGGTLFLDEIGELPPRLQPKLLRILETGEAQPLGGRGSARYDVRIVAATHRDLHQEVARGAFRGDLYYRLAVVEICLPALRERIEDIPRLVEVFLRAGGAPSQDLASPNLERLTRYAWPGNVRELRNVVSRAVALSPPGTPFSQMPVLLGAGVRSAPAPTEDAAPSARADRPFVEAKAALVERFERDYIKDLLARHGDNLSEAARVAGIERKHLYRIMARLGLSHDS
jgi:DNA-binding NtrC family response regulator